MRHAEPCQYEYIKPENDRGEFKKLDDVLNLLVTDYIGGFLDESPSRLNTDTQSCGPSAGQLSGRPDRA